MYIIVKDSYIEGYTRTFKDVKKYIRNIIKKYNNSFDDVSIVYGLAKVEIYEPNNLWFFSSIFSQKRLCEIRYLKLDNVNESEGSDNGGDDDKDGGGDEK